MPNFGLGIYIDECNCGEVGIVKSKQSISDLWPCQLVKQSGLCFACRIWGLFGSSCYSRAVYSNSLRLYARHETIGTVSRAMCAKAKVEKCLFPEVTVLGGFTILGGPQVNEIRKYYNV